MKIGNVEIRNKFKPGKIVATQGAVALMEEQQVQASDFLKRHLEGDWGEETPPEDARLNESSLSEKNPGRLMSAYIIKGNKSKRLWVATEWDRSVTTLLTPEEY